MTTILLNRRSLLAGGGCVMATGGSTLIASAHAAGLEPTLSMAGGSNNYLPGAPVVDRIGKGGFWMGHRSRVNASKSGRTRLKHTRTTCAVMGPRSLTRTGCSVLRCRKSSPPSANRMAISLMTVVLSRLYFCAP